jgi:hypothetical protein
MEEANKNKWYKKWWFIAIIGVALIIAAIGAARDLAQSVNESTGSSDRNIEATQGLIQHAKSLKGND